MITLHGLLYAATPATRRRRFLGRTDDPLRPYARMAVLLARSARAAGMPFTVVTDDAARVTQLLQAEGAATTLDVREHAFMLDVPTGIPFHAAHFKLDLVRAFAGGEFGTIPGLIDLDAVVLQPLALPDRERLWAYDISDQMWANAVPDRARQDLEHLAQRSLPDCRWFGGEFLVGPVAAFGALWNELSDIWPRYRAGLPRFYHVGDETPLSAALNRMMVDGVNLADAGTARLISRWWSWRTSHPMMSLNAAETCPVLHLPADKRFLANAAGRPFDTAAFRARYRRYAATRCLRERIGSAFAPGRRRSRPHIPRLSS